MPLKFEAGNYCYIKLSGFCISLIPLKMPLKIVAGKAYTVRVSKFCINLIPLKCHHP
jgi:hypothetical protein